LQGIEWIEIPGTRVQVPGTTTVEGRKKNGKEPTKARIAKKFQKFKFARAIRHFSFYF
jgi:hypothetical protein